MSNRSWFYASNGQQQGPFPEAQLRDLIARGTVRADTLVWTEGMSGWQRAGDIPGLVPGGSGPPAIPQPGGPPPMGAAAVLWRRYGGGPLSVDLPLWAFLGRSLVFVIGFVLVIPAPWVAVWFYRWMASRVQVPGRPNLAFTGQVGDIWYVFIAIGVADLCRRSPTSIICSISRFRFRRSVLDGPAMDRRQSQLRTASSCRSAFNGSALGYIGWQRADVRLRHHHHRLGLGDHRLDALDLPQHRRHAARGHLHRHRAWKCCGERSCSRSAAASSFRFRG